MDRHTTAVCRNRRKLDQILRMEEEPGGLSGGGCTWKKTNEVSDRCGLGKSMETACTATGGAICALAASNIDCGRRTSVRQHECEAGISIDPHRCAMCLQHSRSESVISCAELTHAITGYPHMTARRRRPTSLRARFTLTLFYKASPFLTVTGVTIVFETPKLRNFHGTFWGTGQREHFTLSRWIEANRPSLLRTPDVIKVNAGRP